MNHQDIANASTQQGTFNLIERLQGRGYPTEDVVVYLDEKTAWEIAQIDKRINDEKNDARVNALVAKREKLVAEVEKSKYTFTLQGMPNEEYDAIVDESRDTFPVETDSSIHPLTGQKQTWEVPNEDRDELFNRLFLAKAIVKVTDAEGGVDDDIDLVKTTFIMKHAPIDAIRRITKKAEDMRMVGEWMSEIETADF